MAGPDHVYVTTRRITALGHLASFVVGQTRPGPSIHAPTVNYKILPPSRAPFLLQKAEHGPENEENGNGEK